MLHCRSLLPLSVFVSVPSVSCYSYLILPCSTRVSLGILFDSLSSPSPSFSFIISFPILYAPSAPLSLTPSSSLPWCWPKVVSSKAMTPVEMAQLWSAMSCRLCAAADAAAFVLSFAARRRIWRLLLSQAACSGLLVNLPPHGFPPEVLPIPLCFIFRLYPFSSCAQSRKKNKIK